MIRVLILTSSRKGTAAHHLPVLLNNPGIEVAMVVYNKGVVRNKWKHYNRKLKKLFKIGILGTLNGIRMRKWYTDDVEKYLQIEDIAIICQNDNIPYHEVNSINSIETRQYFKAANVDLGISLGNGYIAESVFSIPRLGMINIHHEILPDFQNAQSVIWQIYNGSSKTGYTIHQVSPKIDEGAILYQEIVPIVVKESLRETVSVTYALLIRRSAQGLLIFLRNYMLVTLVGIKQPRGKKYTTPSFHQFMRVKKIHRELWIKATSIS